MKKIILVVILGTLGFLAFPRYVLAQTLSFEPTQLGITVGQQFTMKININTGGQVTSGADVKITYDATILKLESVSNGGFYSNFGSNPVAGTTNKYGINGFEISSTNTKTGTGTLAQVVFSGIANGISSVSFDCTTGDPNDSNIIKANTSDDIINCSSLAPASYTVGPSNATPISDGTSGNPTPSVLPRSGSAEVTIVAIGIGVLLTILGVAFKI